MLTKLSVPDFFDAYIVRMSRVLRADLIRLTFYLLLHENDKWRG